MLNQVQFIQIDYVDEIFLDRGKSAFLRFKGWSFHLGSIFFFAFFRSFIDTVQIIFLSPNFLFILTIIEQIRFIVFPLFLENQ